MSATHLPVAVAVSGGADSLHTLVRLHEAGVPVFALHGLFMRPGILPGVMDEQAAEKREEAALAMRRRLARVCGDLGVALHITDLSAEFLRAVIRPFVQSYAAGLTPNPCALCNASVKFGLLLDSARALGAGRLATGHYVRLLEAPGAGGGPILMPGVDPLKDQSYFLSLVPKAQLAAALFPLGESRKQDVLAALAGRNILPPQPGESQEVCFVPGDDYRAFLPRAAEFLGISLPGPGPMVLTDGHRLCEHKGLWRYTEGQRRGLGLGWKEPLHVIAKRQKDNTLVVGPREAMGTFACLCTDLNILLPPSSWPETVLVKTRYRERPKAAIANLLAAEGAGGASLSIRFHEPDSSIAPGQVAAVYIPVRRDDHAAPFQDACALAAGGVIAQCVSLS